MIQTFTSLFKNKEIRSKIIFTLAMLFIYRLGSGIPVPGVDATALTAGIADNSILGMMNLLGGGALQRLSVFALGVTPYITASIIIQLMSMDVIPALTEMAKSGQQGRMKMDKITRYMGVVLAFIQAFTMVYAFDKSYGILSGAGVSTYLYVATVLTAGTMFLLWVGDQISVKGIGNGVSIIIFAGIVANIPFQFIQVFNTTLNHILSLQKPLGLCIYAVLIVLFTFFYTNLQVDPEKIAENLGKSGTYIPGIRPGTETKEYLSKVLNRITVLGAIFLVFNALLPYGPFS